MEIHDRNHELMIALHLFQMPEHLEVGMTGQLVSKQKYICAKIFPVMYKNKPQECWVISISSCF